MTALDWASLAVAAISILGSVAIGIKWLVKHYLNELKPNGGSSMKDEIREIKSELGFTKEQVSLLTDLVKEALKR